MEWVIELGFVGLAKLLSVSLCPWSAEPVSKSIPALLFSQTPLKIYSVELSIVGGVVNVKSLNFLPELSILTATVIPLVMIAKDECKTMVPFIS